MATELITFDVDFNCVEPETWRVIINVAAQEEDARAAYNLVAGTEVLLRESNEAQCRAILFRGRHPEVNPWVAEIIPHTFVNV